MLMKLDEVYGVYVNQYLSNPNGDLLFASMWCRDTSAQEMIARIQLGANKDGITSLSLFDNDGTRKAQMNVPNVDRLDKKIARSENHILGSLVNIWLYDKICVDPDMANRRAVVMTLDGDVAPDIWEVFKSLCPVPLLDSWEEPVLQEVKSLEWIQYYNSGVGVSAIAISIGDDISEIITSLVRKGVLTLPGVEPYRYEQDNNDEDRFSSLSLFGDVIHSYTRADAIDNGYLVDVSEIAREAGFVYPVAITREAWDACVAWDKDDSKQQSYQDQEGRLWDVVFMARAAIKPLMGGSSKLSSSESGDQCLYQLYCIPRDGKSKRSKLTTLKMVVGPGDNLEPVITIMLPNES